MPDDMVFAAVGDCIITRKVSVDTDPAFLDLVKVIKSADVRFANLEIMTPREPVIPSSEYGGMHLGARPLVLDELKEMGFNLYNVANNHATDYTFIGLMDTLRELEARGMVYAGAGSDLGRARAPAYLETSRGRVALIGAASTFVTGALAASNRADMGGRPGINPLRYEVEYVLTEEQLESLRGIDEALGTAATTRRQRGLGRYVEESEDEVYRFLDKRFVVGEEPGVRTRPHERDLEDIARWVDDARRQTDLVAVSLHAHEGQAGDSNTSDIADFILTAARRLVDAGADVVVGHGSHVLRGIEIYRGRPIFYSLGNFLYTSETIERLPTEMYEAVGLDAIESTPADVADRRTRFEDGRPKGFHTSIAFWQSVVPVCRFSPEGISQLELHPITLRFDKERPQRGSPALADTEEAERILEGLRDLSEELGTTITKETRGERLVGAVDLD